jgi:hypothetical protein
MCEGNSHDKWVILNFSLKVARLGGGDNESGTRAPGADM